METPKAHGQKSADRGYPLAFNRCLDCHPDPHHAQFAARKDGGTCEACHTVNGWKSTSYGVREHAATSYPLEDEMRAYVPRQVLTKLKKG